jgi:transaldolase
MGGDPLTARAVFLDRDGVLNRAVIRNGRPFPPAAADELEIVADARMSLRRLREAGFRVVVVTNQPDVARGTQSIERVEAIHAVLASSLPIDEFRVCYHDDIDACRCRKPSPGMLLEAAALSDLSLEQSFLVGDRWRDIEAGRRAGCRTVLVGDGYQEDVKMAPNARVASLTQAVDWILTASEADAVAPRVASLKVKIFADGADLQSIVEMAGHQYIRGFTTNPTLMRKAGVRDYEAFARDVVRAVPDRPISFEVLSDSFSEMERQARKIAAWGHNVNVKIPVTNSCGEPAYDLIQKLSGDGVKVNVTAVFTLEQVRMLMDCLADRAPAFISLFAGRIADTGHDPTPVVASAVDLLKPAKNIELIWASPRELLNLFQADAAGCQIITMTVDLLKKLPLVDRAHALCSLDTVQMFYRDAQQAGFRL